MDDPEETVVPIHIEGATDEPTRAVAEACAVDLCEPYEHLMNAAGERSLLPTLAHRGLHA